MSIKLESDNAAVGIKYQYSVDSSADYFRVPINTYFYNKQTKQVYYKDVDGQILNPFSYKNYTNGITEVDENYQVLLTDKTIIANEGCNTITLPLALGHNNIFDINNNTSGNITINTLENNVVLVDSSFVLYKDENLTIQSDGNIKYKVK